MSHKSSERLAEGQRVPKKCVFSLFCFFFFKLE